MNSVEIRDSFLNFFAKKQHSIVKSSSLMPDSPNLLFTNAGMNQFVPYFLGDRSAPFKRAADTQKCIRAGGKHNDLEDVGFDTYHHTFFEMLGNWSFGDYFKRESIEWAWELLTKVWKFPKERLYATVYKPLPGQPSSLDSEAYDIWEGIFKREGLDPDVHIKFGGAKENFWMMGDTGPCGPCSELHIDLTESGDTKGALVNSDNPYCIELWNLVFIQFNACGDGKFEKLPSCHVDTGMGLERVVGIIARTKNFTDFSHLPSNYDSDLFVDIFAELEKISGKKYCGTLPKSRVGMSAQEFSDFAFRAIADHVRTLSFAVADGIFPSNEGRGYVLRRILRRAVMFGRKLNLKSGFFSELSKVLIKKMGVVFPELNAAHEVTSRVLSSEEQAFERAIDRGISMLTKLFEKNSNKEISGADVFALYDTSGFPVDLTQLLAAEHGFTVDIAGFNKLMEEQRAIARKSQKRSVVELASGTHNKTDFVGYDHKNLVNFQAKIIDVIYDADNCIIVTDKTPFYAECGGQIADKGTISVDGEVFKVVDVKKDKSGLILHFIDRLLEHDVEKSSAIMNVDLAHRSDIERNHTATHLLHWALREVLGSHVKQAGSFVCDSKLRFDFNHFKAINKSDLHKIESLVCEKILSNSDVMWREVKFADKPSECIANFGEKYGDIVRVVDVDGFSVELCGGCHVNAIGEIGNFIITNESAISSGVRRIEAVTGRAAMELCSSDRCLISDVCEELECNHDDLLQKTRDVKKELSEFRSVFSKQQMASVQLIIDDLVKKVERRSGVNFVRGVVDADADDVRKIAAAVMKKIASGVVILEGNCGKRTNVVAICSDDAIVAGQHAGNIVKEIVSKHGGKCGGRPDFAMGGFQN